MLKVMLVSGLTKQAFDELNKLKERLEKNEQYDKAEAQRRRQQASERSRGMA